MMDYTTILSTLWNKVSKPAPNIFIGLAFLYFAPSGMNWFGYVFLAIGTASIFEWCYSKVLTRIETYQESNKIGNTLRSLNVGETKLIEKMLSKNEQTISINYNDYHRVTGDASLGGRREYVEFFGICNGLASKGLLHTASLDEVTTYSFYPEVWMIMKKIYIATPELFRVKEI